MVLLSVHISSFEEPSLRKTVCNYNKTLDDWISSTYSTTEGCSSDISALPPSQDSMSHRRMLRDSDEKSHHGSYVAEGATIGQDSTGNDLKGAEEDYTFPLRDGRMSLSLAGWVRFILTCPSRYFLKNG